MLRVEEENNELSESSAFKNRFDIYNETEFHALLKHERHRTDRSCQSFSLIIVDVKKLMRNKNSLRQYINTIRKRIRIVDVIGWFSDMRVLGILLVATDLESAKSIADELNKSLTDSLMIPTTIYCYPHNWNNIFLKSVTDSNRKERSIIHNKVVKKVENLFIQKLPVWKRLIDIAISLTVLTLFSPLFLIISLYIKLMSRGPILFKQQRIGLNGKEFTLLKFRTMFMNNNINSHQLYLKELINSEKPMYKLDIQKDSRIIPGGCFLRNSGLDELPQIINILKGEMSFVGPRPSIPYEVNEFLLWHKSRFDVTPGLTGLWQVSGKNKLSFAQMIRLDIEYGKKMSIWLDLMIILKTFPTIIKIMTEKTINKTSPQDASG